MFKSIIISTSFHLSIIALTVISLPFIAKKPINIPPIVSIELIQITDITNIPFASKANSYNYGCGRLGNGQNSNSLSDIVFQVNENSTSIQCYVNDGNINASMINGQHIIFTVLYEAA